MDDISVYREIVRAKDLEIASLKRERDHTRELHAELLRERAALHAARDNAMFDYNRVQQECRVLSEVLDASIEDYNRMKQSYELKVEDFAKETLARSEALAQLAEARRRIVELGAQRES